MTYQFSVNNAVASDDGATVLFGLKQHLLSVGWTIITYTKRAKDSNALAPAPPLNYVYWTTTDPAGAYPNPPPFGGPLVDETVIEII